MNGKLINTIVTVMARNPHMRLGQIISNALDLKACPSSLGPDLFYVEDDKLAEALEKYIQTNG